VLIRPLVQSRVDQDQFVDRTGETRSVLSAARASRPVLLLGEPGSGRTSLLNHVAWSLARADDPIDSVLISGEIARDSAQLLGVLVARVQRLADPGGRPGRWIEDLRALSMPDGPFGQVIQPAILIELIDLLGERLADLQRPVCLMVDGLAPKVAHGMFGTLRNELWTLEGVRWVLAGDTTAGPQYREPPADAFFEHVIELGPLSDAEATTLLGARVPRLPSSAIERAVAAGQGNPRRLLRAANDIEAGIDPTDPANDELAAVAAGIAGPLAGALVKYLAVHGPTAASEDKMLRQIGLSRQRASQMMHQLEAAGLLETLEQHTPGKRGRPARRFTLTTSV
jgi:hypothetical protein